jgi:hypothetical protein
MTDDYKNKEYLTDDLDIDGDVKDFSDSNKEKESDEDVDMPSIAKVVTDEEDIFGEENDDIKDESVEIQVSKVALIKKLLKNVKENNDQVIKLLAGLISEEDERIAIGQIGERSDTEDESEVEGKIVEGVFDGENMIGPDGKQYTVPANYASKSKLVEGDILKLTITHSGTFVYKQIGPIERIRAVGILERDNEGNCFVNADGKKWRILPASATYFKGDVGDEVVLLVPKTGESKWGAVENIIKNPAS